MSDERIINDAGYVAIKWVLPRPAKPVIIDGEETVYLFTPKQNIWMAWVKPEHVDRLLVFKEKTCNCNNGVYKNAFMLCNQLDVCLWMTGQRC